MHYIDINELWENWLEESPKKKKLYATYAMGIKKIHTHKFELKQKIHGV